MFTCLSPKIVVRRDKVDAACEGVQHMNLMLADGFRRNNMPYATDNVVSLRENGLRPQNGVSTSLHQNNTKRFDAQLAHGRQHHDDTSCSVLIAIFVVTTACGRLSASLPPTDSWTGHGVSVPLPVIGGAESRSKRLIS